MMRPIAVRRFEDLSKAQRQRLRIILLVRAFVVAVLLFVGYYALPLNRPTQAGVVVLIVGLLVLGLVLAWQIRAIVGSPFPRLRAFEALAIGVPLLLIVFASAYYLIEQSDPNSFTQSLGKTDALYFAVTIFSTVGFGDITAKTELARILVSIQMMFDLVVFGLVAKLIFGAVEIGLKRQQDSSKEPAAAGGVPAAEAEAVLPNELT